MAIACSASAVIVRLGLTPTFAGTADAVADEQVLVAEHALAGVDDAASRVGADHRAAEDVRGASGCSAAASMIELCAIPPVRSASHSANCVGDRDEGRVRALRVLLGLQPDAAAAALRAARSAIALSSVCITSTMIVRRDQPRGLSVRAKLHRVAERSRRAASAAA